MDRTLQKICGLLQDADNMRRCAAAITLGELAPKDAAVVKALGETLANANPMLTTYVLKALEQIGSAAAVPFVLPLLDVADMETKLRVAAIVAKAGSEVVADVAARLEKAPRAEKPLLVDILARIHSRDAFEAILNILFDPDFEIVKQACDAVRRHVADTAPKDRAALHKLIVQFMQTPRVKAHERVLTSSLLLLGYVGQPEARTLLLKYASPKTPSYVRHHALIALKSPKWTGAAAKALAREMLPYLNDPDADTVRHALDILGRLGLPASPPAPWLKLMRSPHAIVRAFAARKVAEVDSAAHNRELLAMLRHEDTEVCEIASSALAAHKGATKLLLDALAHESDGEAAWRLAKMLKPHAEGLSAATLKPFVALATRDMAEGHPRYEALLYFLRSVDAKAADAVLHKAGLEFKRQARWAQAVECLRRLMNTESFDDDTRYALSVCNLKQSPKDLSPHARSEDHALRGFHALLRSPGFGLLERLTKDATLEAADLYYVGFHFSEAPGEDQTFGEQLLRHVAKRWPRSEIGRAAKGKRKLSASP